MSESLLIAAVAIIVAAITILGLAICVLAGYLARVACHEDGTSVT